MTTALPTSSPVLDAVERIIPDIAARAAEIEAARGVPTDLIDALTDAGVFRMFLPHELGGENLSLAQGTDVLRAIARADASTAWTVMVGADYALVWGRFPREVLDHVFAGGPDVRARGAFAPKGFATVTDGGYTVAGQWPLASGSYDYDWVVANCIVIEDGAPRIGALGVPELRMVLMPRDDVEFLDTWDAVGLRATASTDFVVRDKFVPANRAADVFGAATLDTPIYSLPFRVAAGPTHCGVVLGIAEGALDDLKAVAATKRPAFNPTITIAQDPVVQHQIGRLDVRLRAARALAYSEVAQAWEHALDGTKQSEADSVRLRAMTSHVHTECLAIVNEAYTLSGSTALYNKSTLQRRWRDVRAACQHLVASAENFTILGALLLGQETPPMAVDK